MTAIDQSEILIMRYEYYITSLLSKESIRENYNAIHQAAKDSVIFCCTQAQKTSDIRGFNYWEDIIEIIQNSK